MQLLLPLLNRSLFEFADKENSYRVCSYGLTLGHAFYRNFSKYLWIKGETNNEDKLNMIATERFDVLQLKFVPFLVILNKQKDDLDIVEFDGDKIFCTEAFQKNVLNKINAQ